MRSPEIFTREKSYDKTYLPENVLINRVFFVLAALLNANSPQWKIRQMPRLREDEKV